MIVQRLSLAGSINILQNLKISVISAMALWPIKNKKSSLGLRKLFKTYLSVLKLFFQKICY